ncbi:MAG: hypothetical protein QXH71_03930 [Candidatus Anstonellaceae archaeon]
MKDIKKTAKKVSKTKKALKPKKRIKEKTAKNLRKVGKTIEIKKAKIKKESKTKKKRIKEPLNKCWIEVIFKDPEMRKWAVRQIGEHVIEVINKMDGPLSDEEIAKRTELKPSDVRVVLNRLHAHGLAKYTRNRDKKSGWYNYIWALLPQEAMEFYEGFKKLKEETNKEITEDQELYYSIVDGKIKIYTFEEAFNNRFICPITGKPLKYLDKKELEKIEKEKREI